MATPIGNLADISLRALYVLQLADSIACEDTRHTQSMLRAYGIDKAGDRLLALRHVRDAALYRAEAYAIVARAGKAPRKKGT